MLDDAPPFCVPVDNIRLSIVEDVPIVIPSDIGLGGELDIAFLFFSCFGLAKKIVSESTSPRWPKPEASQSTWSDVMRLLYKV